MIESEADAEAIEVDDPTKVVYLANHAEYRRRRTHHHHSETLVPRDQSPLARTFTTRRPIVGVSLSLPIASTACWSSASNSSNSVRLAEIAENRGTKAMRTICP